MESPRRSLTTRVQRSSMIPILSSTLGHRLPVTLGLHKLELQALRLKGLIKKTLSLSTVLLPDNNRFVERFVTKFEHQLPELWSVYEMKVDFSSVV